MAHIETTSNRFGNIMIHCLQGEVTGDEIIDQIKKDVSDAHFPSHVVWDFTRADMHLLNRDKLQDILVAGKKLADKRSSGKTAIVVPKDLSYGLGRMYEILTEMEGFRTQNRSFRSLDQALEWLTDHPS
jgi:hypothetical protein